MTIMADETGLCQAMDFPSQSVSDLVHHRLRGIFHAFEESRRIMAEEVESCRLCGRSAHPLGLITCRCK